MIEEEERREIVLATRSNAKDMLDAAKQKAGFDTMYPEGERRKKSLIPFVSRFQGPIPDAYDYVAAGVQLEMTDFLDRKAIAVLEGRPDDSRFDYEKAVSNPILHVLQDMTVSMGGGKGRKEGMEMAKSNPPVEQKSRWSWGRGR